MGRSKPHAGLLCLIRVRHGRQTFGSDPCCDTRHRVPTLLCLAGSNFLWPPRRARRVGATGVAPHVQCSLLDFHAEQTDPCIADWYLPNASQTFMPDPRVDKSIIRIISAHRWPEKQKRRHSATGLSMAKYRDRSSVFALATPLTFI
jgi:hypothetical protein